MTTQIKPCTSFAVQNSVDRLYKDPSLRDYLSLRSCLKNISEADFTTKMQKDTALIAQTNSQAKQLVPILDTAVNGYISKDPLLIVAGYAIEYTIELA